ncbi:hypothetical protein V3W47_19035 [Deinococcus sp. YIM 134068]|uniref:hypothetical protein n=1 Tax=Deinococcus lichenicola TaxID=3118910 RepID=UPI002F9497A9
MSRRRKSSDTLSGGDLLTWALVLGVGSLAAWKGVQELRELKAAQTGTTTGTTVSGTGSAGYTLPVQQPITTGGAVVPTTTATVVGVAATSPAVVAAIETAVSIPIVTPVLVEQPVVTAPRLTLDMGMGSGGTSGGGTMWAGGTPPSVFDETLGGPRPVSPAVPALIQRPTVEVVAGIVAKLPTVPIIKTPTIQPVTPQPAVEREIPWIERQG